MKKEDWKYAALGLGVVLLDFFIVQVTFNEVVAKILTAPTISYGEAILLTIFATSVFGKSSIMTTINRLSKEEKESNKQQEESKIKGTTWDTKQV